MKDSLVVDLGTTDEGLAKKYNVKAGTKLLTYDFVLVTDDESRQLREKNAMEAMEKLGKKMKLWNGLPVSWTSPLTYLLLLI